MPSPEQLPLDFNPKFDRSRMELARIALSGLEVVDYPWPEEVEPYSQLQWDNFRHNAYDNDWLERRISKMIQRGRVPFHITRSTDRSTGEITDVQAFSKYETADFFRYKTVPKPTVSSGHKKRKRRTIHAPNAPMENVQLAFLDWARDNYDLHDAAFGAESDKSYLDAAIAHAGNRYFLKLDIASAYDAVDAQRLAVQLADTEGSTVGPGGWFPIVRRFFVPPGQTKGIATGGNASPILFNIYMRPVDEAISLYAQAYGMTYTRLMDDIVLSAPDTDDPDFDRIGRGKARFVKQTLNAVGMKVNDHKVRYKDLKTEGPILLMGAQLDANGDWQIPERSVRNIADFFDYAMEILESTTDPDEFELKTLIGEVHGINSYIQHFISRRDGVIHPSEEMLTAKYWNCVEAIRAY